MSILTSAHYAVHCLYLDQGFCIIYMTGFRTDVLKMTIFKIDIFKLIECVEQQEQKCAGLFFKRPSNFENAHHEKRQMCGISRCRTSQ